MIISFWNENSFFKCLYVIAQYNPVNHYNISSGKAIATDVVCDDNIY